METKTISEMSHPVHEEEMQNHESRETDDNADISIGVPKHLLIINSESKENDGKVISECVTVPEGQHAMNTETKAKLEKIPGSVPKEDIQNQDNQKVNDYNTEISIEVPEHSLITISESKENEVKVISECVSVPESQTEMDIQATTSEEMSAAAPKQDIQNQDDQKVNDDNTDICIEVPEHLLVTNSESKVNDDKVISKCVMMPESQTEMDIQATTSKEISDAAPKQDIQNRDNQKANDNNTEICIEVPEHALVTNSESKESEDKVISECVMMPESQIEMDIQAARSEEISDAAPKLDIQNQDNQKVNDNNTDICIEVPEHPLVTNSESKENNNKVISECVSVPERQTEMDIQATTSEEMSDPVHKEDIRKQGNQEVNEHTTDISIEAQKDLLIANPEGKQNEDKVIPDCVSVPERQIEMDMPTSTSSAEMADPVPTEEVRSQEVSEHTTAISNETKEGLLIANSESNENENMVVTDANSVPDSQTDVDVITGSIVEEAESVPEQETVGQVIHEVREDATFITGEGVNKTASNREGQGEGNRNNEVIVFVSHQQEDNVIQSSDVVTPDYISEPVETVNQSDVELNEMQVVYEAISSPESNADTEFHTASYNKPDSVTLPNIESKETQEVKEDLPTVSTNEVNILASNPQEENEENSGNGVICVPDSRADMEMDIQTFSVAESSSSEQVEPSNGTVEVKQVTVTSSSDDIGMPDSQMSEDVRERNERNGFPESTDAPECSEQEQEDKGLKEIVDNTTTTTDAAGGDMPDSTSQDVVVLELVSVPESEVHIDIVTQAAAESGLTTSLSEEMNPESSLAGGHEESERIDDTQQCLSSQVNVQQCQRTDEVKEATVTNSSEELHENLETKHGADATPLPPLEEAFQVIEDSGHSEQPPSEMKDLNATENEMANSQAHEPSEALKEDSDVLVTENVGGSLSVQELHILEHMGIAHEIVVMVVGENEEEVYSEMGSIEKSQETTEAIPVKEEKAYQGKHTEDTQQCEASSKQNSTPILKAEDIKKELREEAVGKPKKQEMNTQARTKARLAALAEQKAAASKRTANRQQLNLLALCEEIAEDIATDSMLLKRIEEEKQAAAAKNEAIKKESPPVSIQDAETVSVPTPAGPEVCSPSVPPADEASEAKPTTSDSTEAKPAPEPPKRRFFVSQITVPLKAHEKKKLTRYQRLRQVELQREKMSWTRVKKLKSDQANQMMFSDIDGQSPLSLLSPFTPAALATTSPPVASASKTAVPSPATASKPTTPKPELPKPELPKVVTPKALTPKAVTPKALTPKALTPKAEPTQDETPKAETPKAEAPKATPTQGLTPKVTRSSTKKTLPAVPPPMPNGLNTKKSKPVVEYKPYRPRPKYSPDDFELDDDPLPVVQTKPMLQSRPTPPTGPNLQSKSTTQSKPTLQSKPMVPSQLTNQTKPKAQTMPAAQVPGHSKPIVSPTGQSKPAVLTTGQSKVVSTTLQSKPAIATAPRSKANITSVAQSKPAVSAKPQIKPPISTTPQSKAAVPTPGQSTAPQSKPTGSTASQSKPAGTATAQQKPATPTGVQQKSAVSTAADTKPAVPKAEVSLEPPKDPASLKNGKCEDSTEPISSAPTSSVPSKENLRHSDGTQPCDKKPAENESDAAKPAEKTTGNLSERGSVKAEGNGTPLSDASLQKEVKKLKEADKDGNQTIIDAGQKHFGAVACSVCGMLYSAANPEDESQHLLFHNQFVSAVKYVGWKKERILGEYPDGKIILVLPDDPKYALKKVEEIREMVDNDLGFQQVETKCPSQTKTFLFISNDKKVAGCLIAEHIQEGYRVIEEAVPEGSEGEKVMFERQRAWCCSTTPEPALCGISRIWVFSMMRRQGIASRMIECLRNNFIYGSYLSKDEIAFSDPTPDGKLFATHYFGTSQFLVYNFVSGTRPSQRKPNAV
ncbi:uncharacterized protein ACJ7VT_016482 isoform 2-T2 [Polymixia lowei]